MLIDRLPRSFSGGKKGFDKQVWQISPLEVPDGQAVCCQRVAKDGEEGYPGYVHTSVIYHLTSGGELLVQMEASDATQETPVSMAHHSYFNLGGHYKMKNVLNHEVFINADGYTPVDEELIPTGMVESVRNTPFDFTTARKIGDRIGEVPGGYDHNYVLNSRGTNPKGPLTFVAATVVEPISGRAMDVYTDAKGMQFYTGNFLNGMSGKHGVRYKRHFGFCLETQTFPNAINEPEFGQDIILRPKGWYTHRVKFHFRIEGQEIGATSRPQLLGQASTPRTATRGRKPGGGY